MVPTLRSMGGQKIGAQLTAAQLKLEPPGAMDPEPKGRENVNGRKSGMTGESVSISHL